MGRLKKYPDSWIDKEQLSSGAYRFLRDLVVVHQTRKELIKALTETSIIDESKLRPSVVLDIKKWLYDAEVLELRIDNKKLESELWNLKFPPPPPPPPKKDGLKFELFKKELNLLLKKYMVTIGYNWDDQLTVYPARYEEDEQPDICLANDITLEESK